ncbi:MAG: hypothetical protein AAB373_04300 [Patescibacteria group bacterium]
MNLLQIKIDDNLKKAIQDKAEIYGVPASSLIRIVLVKSFLPEKEGNVFNAKRDNNGKGIQLDKLIDSL